jgi:hypothetical protein
MYNHHFFIIPGSLVIFEDNATQIAAKARKIEDILGLTLKI